MFDTVPELLPPDVAPPVVMLPPPCPDTFTLVVAPEALTVPLLLVPLFVVPLDALVDPAAVVSPEANAIPTLDVTMRATLKLMARSFERRRQER